MLNSSCGRRRSGDIKSDHTWFTGSRGRPAASAALTLEGPMQVGRRILRTALIARSALGPTAAGSVLALASGPAPQASTACAAAWSSSTVYTAGNQASENGINYTANWWTQGNNPATNNGGSGSGQPWTSNGACTGGSGGTPPGGGGTPPGGGGTGTGSVSGLLFSPYKDVTINMNWNTYQMQSAVEGSAIPVVGSGSVG